MKAFQNWRGRLQAVALAAAALTVFSIANVAARQEPPGRPFGRGMHSPMPFGQLNLSADQKTRVEAIFEKHREADQPLFEQLRTANESLRSAIFGSASPEAGQIEDLTNQIAELEAKALRARIATQVELASVLTPEQRQKMLEMRPPTAGRRGPRG